MSTISTARQGSVAVIRFGEPPVNSLGARTRAELTAAVDAAVADPAVTAIVIAGQNGLFSAGADIREFGTPAMLAAPNLHNVIASVETSPKPVVAAIEGNCLGGGLELALGCHYRVASEGARLGLPEVKIGLLPGAGGTQRLPRLIGVENAINVILGGEPVPAKLFKGSPLLDALVAGDPVPSAVALAAEKAAALAAGGKLPKARDRKVPGGANEALLGFARTTVGATFPNFPAPLKCLDAIEAAATKSFDEGLARERELFGELMLTPVSRALRNAFFAERAAAKIPDVPESTPTRTIGAAAVIGAGTMGTGIAINFLNAGIPVKLLEVGQEALDKGVARIRDTYAGQVKKGRLKPADAEARAALLTPTLRYEDVGGADIVIEAVFEDMAVKEKVFGTLDKVMKPGAILATNTSTLDVDHIAAITKRPADVIGTHFFSPANVMRLLEVVRGKATAKDVLATTMKLAKSLKKTAVVSGVCDGFIGNRMIEQYSRQALFMVDEGASPAEIDGAIEKFGFAMGPFRMSDLAGNDIGWHIRKRRAIEHPQMAYSKIGDKLCELGRFGQKTQAGWYDYRPGDRTAYPSKVVDDLIAANRAAIGVKPRRLDAREIVDRLVLALVNEAARILEEGIALRASDIDVVYLTGYGFPVWRGGPMCYADELGVYAVAQRMRELGRNPYGDPGFWTPAPLIQRLAASGGAFNSVGARS
ncbi:MAG TPA: 3-hydroxyacyl-CoA dehydrogenase NAD-binding domain-containing protein [Steroidobacteraceae bacterium]|nr:3-hydroxyacyl-CoA dehydrogenase NAD-binding domain-containing protein [Steroidobacteraceae bacterium]